MGSIIGGQNIINSATKVMDTLAICAPRIAQDAALLASIISNSGLPIRESAS